MRNIFTLIVFLISIYGVKGQELMITPLSGNPKLIKQFEAGELSFPNQKSNITLHLPFIDDFSKNHQPGSAIQYWDDNFAFINPTYGVDPPTIGVATFDGIDFDGYPYDFENPNAEGIADYLTSCKINLQEDESGVPYDLSDSIIFSFYYQPGGLGFAPRPQDSLVLEFYDSEDDVWVRQWGKSGSGLSDFKLIYIPIVNNRFLNDDFRFRFRNRGRLSGNLDLWHIDMVWMDKNRSSFATSFEDVGYQYPVNNMMNNYTSIPYKHYKSTSSIHMADKVVARLINNQEFAINLSNVKMRNFSQGSLVNESAIPGAINFPGQTSNDFDISMGDYIFDPDIDEPFVSFENEFVMASGAFDLVPDNDTINFTQHFENYYAYDDGSAEGGIGFPVEGFMAVKYEALQADSMIGFKMFFNPIYKKPVFHFVMYVWDEGPSGPGDVIYVNQSPVFVEYVQEGHDVFEYYFFDEAVFVSGTYYAGIWQSPPTSTGVYNLRLGFDLNTDKSDITFARNTVFSQWVSFEDNGFPGTIMLRPVFQSELDSIIMGVSTALLPQFSVYPNPSSNRVTIKNLKNEEMDILLISLDGRVILKEHITHDIELDVSGIPSGMYLVRAVNNDGLAKVEKILVNH